MTRKAGKGKAGKAPSRKKKPKKVHVPLWRQPVLWGVVLALAAFAVMVLFGRLPAPQVETDHAGVSEEVVLDNLRAEVDGLLVRLGVAEDAIERRPTEGMLDLRVRHTYPEQAQVDDFSGRVSELSSKLHLDLYPDGNELRVFFGPAMAVRLRFTPPAENLLPSGPLIAIVVDDIGRDLTKVQRLLSLPQTVTLAILPSTPHAAESARLAHAAGREVMVHIPMEPQGYPAIEPGRDALLLEHSAWEIERRLSDMFTRVPYVTGGNNHMGSRFTEYADGMAVVADFMKDRHLFFVDSRTTGNTLAEQTMREYQVPTVSRDVFLDNEQDVEKIRAQIRHLAGLAKRQGRALGIGHPHSETLAALEMELPLLQGEGIVFVSVSKLLERGQLRGN